MIQCSNENCPLWTKIVVPSDYGLSNKNVVCSFCSASPPHQNKQSHATGMGTILKEGKCSPTETAKKLILEEKIIEEENSNLILAEIKADSFNFDVQLVTSICV